MSEKKLVRKTWIDLSKGVLIIFVILGHCITNNVIKSWLSSFYMPCFFILSGLLMKQEDDCKRFIIKKVKGILFPYVFFSLIWIIFCFVKSFIIESDFNIYRALLSIVIPYSGSPGGNVYNLWFLPCLFLSQVIVFLFVNKKLACRIFAGLAWISFLILGLFIKPYCSLLMATAIASVFVFLGCYFSGYFLKNTKVIKNLEYIILILVLGIIHIASFILNVIVLDNSLDFSVTAFGVLPIYLIGAISGSLLLIAIVGKIKSFRLFEYIGKNSLVFYALHYEVMAIAGFLTAKIINNNLIITILSFTITIVGTTIVAVIYNKLNIGKLFR